MSRRWSQCNRVANHESSIFDHGEPFLEPGGWQRAFRIIRGSLRYIVPVRKIEYDRVGIE